MPSFDWRERVYRKVFWLIMDELIGQLGYHSSMVLNCDVQFRYRVQCRNLDRQCDWNEGDKDCDTSILLEQRRIYSRKEKVKGRYLLDSVACGAHYGRHVVRDSIYHMPFERWDHDFEPSAGRYPATCRCFIRVPPYVCLKDLEAQITGTFLGLVLYGVAERMEQNGPYKVRDSVHSTALSASNLWTRLWSCWKLPLN